MRIRPFLPAILPSTSAFALIGLIALSISTAPAGAQWPSGVGGNPARNGLVDCAGPQEPLLSWQGSRSSIVAQQGVSVGDLVVVNRITSFTIPTGTWIVAHELADGAERWAVQLPYDFPGTSWRSRVSAIRDGQVYASRSGNTNEDYLYALSPADGSILWRSEALIGEGSTESLCFAANGDPIAGNMDALIRIDRTDGTTVWSVSRSCSSSDGAMASVHGNRAYVWEASPYGPIVTAFDLDEGERLFSTPAIAGGLVQQLGLLCGPDGTIYAPRTQNNPATDFFVALADTGMGFEEQWRVPLGYVPFASFGVGPDGSVYTYAPETDPDMYVLRLDPETGDELDRSPPIPSDWPVKPRIAIDTQGTVFLTNGGFAQGAVYAFTPDLQIIWWEPLNGVNLGGPVLAEDGTLIVCGTGTDVRAYAGCSGGVGDRPWAGTDGLYLAPGAPNPFTSGTRLVFELAAGGDVGVRILNAQGRLVRHLMPERFLREGRHTVTWDGRDGMGRPVEAGVYLVSVGSGPTTAVRKLVLRR